MRGGGGLGGSDFGLRAVKAVHHRGNVPLWATFECSSLSAAKNYPVSTQCSTVGRLFFVHLSYISDKAGPVRLLEKVYLGNSIEFQQSY